MNIRYLALAFLLSAGLLAAACGDDDASPKAPDAPIIEDRGTAELTWWGQAMFTLVATDGTRIVFDPYSEIGYQVPTAEELAADVMTVSHEHPDHNNVALAGDATVLRGLADGDWVHFDETFGDTRIFSIESFHDRNNGQERGLNTIFVIETGGLRIAHLGDFGELELTADQLDDLGAIDVLLIPVGGVFTIDAAGATAIVEQIGPRMVIPMHFGTPSLSIGLEAVDAFLEGKNARELGSSTVGFDVDALPAPGSAEIWVLDPAGG
ncbi:MAG: MBL fold metallo-hydrolase [Chloroflexi bacterium]|nr:MBL fold metallo-hydrolase [Chloroflexota bacterium]